MASKKNDELRARTVEGSVNLYDDQKCIGTANDKAIAARLGGHNYNIVNNQARDEIYMPQLRHDDHFVDARNNATNHFFQRRRKYPRKVDLMFDYMRLPEGHPKEAMKQEWRTELQLVQTENFQDYGAYQRKRHQMRPPTPERRRTLDERQKKFDPEVVDKTTFMTKKAMPRSQSTPALQQITAMDPRRRATQLQTESACFADIRTKNTYAMNMENAGGHELTRRQNHSSMQRLENHDFAITRKNNHFSHLDKLTRADPYYMKPRLCTTNNSVKYNPVTNERKFFHYSKNPPS